MAKRVGQSGLAGKLGNAGEQAFETHKADETKYSGGGGLPSGIEGGIAQLSECKFGIYEKGDFQGEYYFYAAGIVVEPKVHNSIPIEGLRTTIGPEPLCDTPTRKRATLADHMAWVLNELRKLGVDTTSITYAQLEDVAASLKAEAPFFRFRTWAGSKQEIVQEGGKWKCGGKTFTSEAAAKAAFPYAGKDPLIQHDWGGQCNYEGKPVDDVVDNTVPAQDDGPSYEPETSTAGGEDLAALGAAADGNDEDAMNRLQEMADAAGIDAAKIPTWAEVASLLMEANDNSGSGDVAANGELGPPTVGEVWFVFPTVRHKRTVEVEITGVDPKTRKCTFKDLASGNVESWGKDRSWDDLLAEAATK